MNGTNDIVDKFKDAWKKYEVVQIYRNTTKNAKNVLGRALSWV
jgi:hypothetical protein